MRLLKKTLKITAFVLLFLIALAFAAPFIFKGKIISLVKKEINNSINAKADFKDVSISFFRSFPRVSVALDSMYIAGINEFEGDTLFAAKEIAASLDIMSVIKGSDFKIYTIMVNDPRIHAIVNKEGKANWDIAKPDTASSATEEPAKPFKLNLEKYSIQNAYIRYEDVPGDMSTEITGLDHEGSGDFTSDLFTLQTGTKAAKVDFSYGGIPYLSRTNANIDADIEIDNKTNTYTFKNANIALNELKLAAIGFFQMTDSAYNMDIKFDAPSTEFKHILSLIPAVYSKDFASVKTSGKAVINGFVKGTYSEIQMPAYNFNVDVADGFFQYPDLPKAVKNINLQLKVDNPDGVTDHTTINIPKAHIEFNNDPFDFRLLVKNPVSNLFLDAAAKGRLDLSSITDFVKLEAGTKLSGLLSADMAVNGYMKAIEQQQYDQFNASGNLDLNNFFYASKDYPGGVKLDKLLLAFNPKNVRVSDLKGQYLNTNFTADGSIDNLLGYALKDQPLEGTLNVKADKLNLNDWMGVPADTATAPQQASAPFAVPSNIKFTVNSSVDEVKYDKLTISNLSGSMQIADETVKLSNIKGNALDGTMQVNGSYSTKESKTKPDISLAYDVKGLDVQKTFYAFNTVQKLMPAGKFIAGKLTSQLSFTGKLGDNMMPDLNSLTGQGNLLLIEGFLKKFAPLDKLASTLNVKELEAISLKDVRNYIEFTNGKVLVKPFKLIVKDIDMEIGGMHGFDQSIDYVINMKVPRSMMGEKGNQFVNNLVTQVNNKGVPVKVSDVVNLNVKMGGTISSPTLKTDLKQSATNLADDLKQQATDFAKQKIDSTKTAVKTAVKDTIASVKKQATDALKDELQRQLSGKKDSTSNTGASDTKKKLTETGKGLVESFNPFKKKKQTDSTKQ